jgi:hypothetical protein
MSEQRWLDGYEGQTTDELIALDGRYRTDSIVLAFEQAINDKAARIGVEHLTRAERVVLAVEALEREVNSGGYFHLFTFVPDPVPELVSALTAIGALDAADITKSAISALEINGPLTSEAVEGAMRRDDDRRDDRLDELAQAYYATVGHLGGPLLAYIKANRDDVTLP